MDLKTQLNELRSLMSSLIDSLEITFDKVLQLEIDFESVIKPEVKDKLKSEVKAKAKPKAKPKAKKVKIDEDKNIFHNPDNDKKEIKLMISECENQSIEYSLLN